MFLVDPDHARSITRPSLSGHGRSTPRGVLNDGSWCAEWVLKPNLPGYIVHGNLDCLESDLILLDICSNPFVVSLEIYISSVADGVD